ncbi:hypothetical protein B2G71_10375 [Novosphingobium sp. PC22D]|uniref:carboxylate--amine ligase n=1 Tax=Novosphingobium sp. PC22D TaxID=1962403 RepID=UPI000BEF3BAC|nr:carboxylate--amine ligase [Novosphingobium sp. PC22D]PEQ12703.1 hypothetical protein B2G71_10375 [Novosphingobium sp. PC22D]
MPVDELAAVLGADSPIGLTVIRELGRHGVPVVALGKSALSIGRHSRYAKGFSIIGKPLADWLPGFVAKKRITAIMAISEHQLVELSLLAPRLEGCTVLCPPPDKLALVLDKRRTLEIAARLGMNVPDSWQPDDPGTFEVHAARLAYPVAVKWPEPGAVMGALATAGLAWEKVEYADGPEALLGILHRYDRIGTWPLVQTWCAGYGLGQMLHMQDGRATLRFQHRRLREWPPTGGVSSLSTTVPLALHAEQMARSEALLREIGWSGPAMVEYRYNPDTGSYWLMEVNGRFWGSLPLASSSGAEFAWELYRRFARGDRSEAPTPLKPRRARFMAPDMKHLVAQWRGGSLSPGRKLKLSAQFLAEFFNPRTEYYVWNWRDPMPLLGDLIDSIRRRLR